MSPTKFVAVAAITKEWGIGSHGNLPWHPRRLHFDMAFLKYVTTHRSRLREAGGVEFVKGEEEGEKNIVIMGRKTWESIPAQFRPMDKRINIIITSKPEEMACEISNMSKVLAVRSFGEAVDAASRFGGQIFILGGSSVYEAALKDPRCEAVFITKLQEHPPMPCNVLFPGHLLMSEGYHRSANITATCWQILSPTLPKSSKAQYDGQLDCVHEGDIDYSIELWCK